MRDALGVVRLLYATRKRAGRLPEPPDVDPLVAIGGELHKALELARGCEPGALGHRAAVARAGKALGQLADEMSMADYLPDVVRVARERATGAPARLGSKGER